MDLHSICKIRQAWLRVRWRAAEAEYLLGKFQVPEGYSLPMVDLFCLQPRYYSTVHEVLWRMLSVVYTRAV